MPWIASSPPSPAASSPCTSPRRTTPPPSLVTYIPPLIDGACGTVPRSRQPLSTLLRNDAAAMLRLAAPTLLLADMRRLWRADSWADACDMLLQATLSLFELAMVLLAAPLWVCLPGAVFALWLSANMAFVAGVSWLLNGRERVVRCTDGLDGWSRAPEAVDERWIFIGGSEKSSRFLLRSALPHLSKLFCRPITAIRVPSYGMLADAGMALLLRSVAFPSSSSRHLYDHVRAALLDPRSSKVIVLADGIGSVHLSRTLGQLYADIIPDKIAKLEIYTFGAAAGEFLMPLGEGLKDQSPPPHGGFNPARTGPHMEHFAHERDSLASFGILRAVREDLEGRFCGGVFVLRDAAGTHPPIRFPAMAMSITDYLSTLFPNRTASAAGGARSILDSIMSIDRDLAEKREFAAMANYASATSAKKGSKRLSWTGLGATVNGENGVMDGVAGLEMARKGCKDCDGHRGTEVSWLVRYVNIGQYDDGTTRTADASPAWGR
ncbi:hypothetical protein NKR23_g7189 [Pleurostoma richardsiae]|uniref:Uncharacterized protein n=1 Tax=Pleurostoma richardsiae TaxID=41990 RepID=A0AA38VN55_9PEZI|nr:hypothetical protein NKR23_g7189 [Pleurostoma richardsiae]